MAWIGLIFPPLLVFVSRRGHFGLDNFRLTH